MVPFFHCCRFSRVRKYEVNSRTFLLEHIVLWTPAWRMPKSAISIDFPWYCHSLFSKKNQAQFCHLDPKRKPFTCTKGLHWIFIGFISCITNRDWLLMQKTMQSFSIFSNCSISNFLPFDKYRPDFCGRGHNGKNTLMGEKPTSKSFPLSLTSKSWSSQNSGNCYYNWFVSTFKHINLRMYIFDFFHEGNNWKLEAFIRVYEGNFFLFLAS